MSKGWPRDLELIALSGVMVLIMLMVAAIGLWTLLK